MNKDQKTKKIKQLVIVNSANGGSMPNAVGDILVFHADDVNFIEEVPESESNGVKFQAWTRINAINGSISASQLLRSGNGLAISGDNNTERLQDLVTNYSDNDMVFSILLADEKIRMIGGNERRYFKVKVVAGEATKVEDFN